jgi:hypothetical protein
MLDCTKGPIKKGQSNETGNILWYIGRRKTFYGRHDDLVDRYGISVSQMTTDMFHLS